MAKLSVSRMWRGLGLVMVFYVLALMLVLAAATIALAIGFSEAQTFYISAIGWPAAGLLMWIWYRLRISGRKTKPDNHDPQTKD
jgi:hypothetical protein